MRVIVDGFGGDNAPVEIVKGCVAAVNHAANLSLIITGDSQKINDILAREKYNKSLIEIIDCKDIISNDDAPTVAIKEKTDSSLVVALENLKNRDDICGLVSAGSTGAVLAGGLLKVGRIPGIKRPALAPILPTITGGSVLLIDCGANVDCKPEYLCQFAIMGSAYMSSMFNIKNPKVGLLSNGTEDKKGNELNKQAFKLLSEMGDINFIGNIEARDNMSGNVDVIVSDGFAGNIALKASEGVAQLIFTCLKQEINKSLKYKIGALLMKRALRQVKKRMDYNNAGGAIFLGASKVIIKSHGSSTATAICNSILQAQAMGESKIIEKISASVVKEA